MKASPADLRIPAADGRSLGATLFRPDAPTGASVIIAPALGIRRHLYGAFAAELARRGARVLTFDCRGTGDSRDGPLRRDPATMSDWGEQDLAGVLAWVRREPPAGPVSLVGHSAGAQLVGLAPGAQHLKALVAVTSGSAYWKHWRGLRRTGMWLLWHAVMPGLTRLLGYLPARALGLGENLPPGVALQWARWSRDPDYLFGDVTLMLERYRRIRAPLLSLSFSDDGYMPESAVRALLRHFPAARIDQRHLTPAEVGHAVGHLGFFQEKSRKTLWPRVTGWLRRHAAI